MGDGNRLSFLVLRAQAGDRSALDELLRQFQLPLHQFLRRLLGNSNDADDALQATFLQVFRKLKYLRNPRAFRPWLWQIANRNARKVLRSKKRRREQYLDLIDAEEVDQSASSELDEELIERIPELMERLTENGREVILLHYLEGFSLPEVAAILEIPLGTAKSRLAYALTCLRRAIDDGGER